MSKKLIWIIVAVVIIIGVTAYFLFRKGGSKTGKEIKGCTDPKASNYNPSATINDGTCVGDDSDSGNNIVKGCTNPQATNYNKNATQDDGSCVFGSGSDVYLKDKGALPGGTFPAGGDAIGGIPVYSNSIADTSGNFLLGVTRAEWYGGSKIGKVIQNTKKSADGSPGNWTQVLIDNWAGALQIWEFNQGRELHLFDGTTVPHGYTTVVKKITGDVWIPTAYIKTF